jgi:hypothetical protein
MEDINRRKNKIIKYCLIFMTIITILNLYYNISQNYTKVTDLHNIIVIIATFFTIIFIKNIESK